MGYGIDGSTCGWMIAKTVYFVLGSFVFSWIFWGTKKWMDSPKKKKKK